MSERKSESMNTSCAIEQNLGVGVSRRLSNAPAYENSTTIIKSPKDQLFLTRPTHLGQTVDKYDDSSSEAAQEKDVEKDVEKEEASCRSEEGQQKQEQTESKKILAVILAWVSMFCAIMAGSLIGPAFKVIHESHINTILAASWRSQCMVLVLLPIAICEYYYLDKSSRVNWFTTVPPGLDYPIIYYTMFAGVLWSANLLLWVVALNWVSTVHAAIFAGMHPILLCLYFALFTTIMPSPLEFLGVMIAFGGLALTATDERGVKTSEEGMEWFGEFLCVLSACAQVGVIVNRKKIIQWVPLFRYTLVTTIVVTAVSSLIAVLFIGCTFSIDDSGVFGWMAEKWIAKIFMFSLIVGVFCIAGFNYAMTHISPLVFSALLLMDPSVTGLVSFCIALEGIPGWFTIFGGGVVLVGVMAIITGEHKRELEYTHGDHLHSQLPQDSIHDSESSGTGFDIGDDDDNDKKNNNNDNDNDNDDDDNDDSYNDDDNANCTGIELQSGKEGDSSSSSSSRV